MIDKSKYESSISSYMEENIPVHEYLKVTRDFIERQIGNKAAERGSFGDTEVVSSDDVGT